jgi:metal-responsive CopG/Arc/MetJ family transcriptional regulator
MTKLIQISIPDELEKKLDEQQGNYTTRNALIISLINRGLEQK